VFASAGFTCSGTEPEVINLDQIPDEPEDPYLEMVAARAGLRPLSEIRNPADLFAAGAIRGWYSSTLLEIREIFHIRPRRGRGAQKVLE